MALAGWYTEGRPPRPGLSHGCGGKTEARGPEEIGLALNAGGRREMGMFDLTLFLGPWEIAGIALIVIVIFGAGRLAGVGKALGQGIREFRQEARTPLDDSEGDESDEDAEATPAGASTKENG